MSGAWSWLRGLLGGRKKGGSSQRAAGKERPTTTEKTRTAEKTHTTESSSQRSSPPVGTERAGAGRSAAESKAAWGGPAGDWRSAAGRGWVWSHREQSGVWTARGTVEQPSEAACFSHSPPDQSLDSYNQRREQQFLRRFKRSFAVAIHEKTAVRYAHWTRIHQNIVLTSANQPISSTS